MKPTAEIKKPIISSEDISVQNCKYVDLDEVLSDVEMELFSRCDWNHFTFGDCDKSLLSRDRMIDELQESSEDFKSAISLLEMLPSHYFVSL